jgi:hypothetical protein
MVVPLLVPPPVSLLAPLLLAPLPALMFAPLRASAQAPELEPAPWHSLLPANSGLSLTQPCLCSAQWEAGV